MLGTGDFQKEALEQGVWMSSNAHCFSLVALNTESTGGVHFLTWHAASMSWNNEKSRAPDPTPILG
jgi:hypothetical protein